MQTYYLTVYAQTGEALLNESFEAENDEAATNMGKEKVKRKRTCRYYPSSRIAGWPSFAISSLMIHNVINNKKDLKRLMAAWGLFPFTERHCCLFRKALLMVL